MCNQSTGRDRSLSRFRIRLRSRNIHRAHRNRSARKQENRTPRDTILNTPDKYNLDWRTRTPSTDTHCSVAIIPDSSKSRLGPPSVLEPASQTSHENEDCCNASISTERTVQVCQRSVVFARLALSVKNLVDIPVSDIVAASRKPL